MVTDVVLFFSPQEETGDGRFPILNEINAWLQGGNPDGFRYGVMARLETGDSKGYALCPIIAGAFNHFDAEAFLRFVLDLPWQAPNRVQLMIKEEHQKRFALYELPPEGTKQVIILVSGLYSEFLNDKAAARHHNEGEVVRLPGWYAESLVGSDLAEYDDTIAPVNTIKGVV